MKEHIASISHNFVLDFVTNILVFEVDEKGNAIDQYDKDVFIGEGYNPVNDIDIDITI